MQIFLEKLDFWLILKSLGDDFLRFSEIGHIQKIIDETSDFCYKGEIWAATCVNRFLDEIRSDTLFSWN